jgi:hypothetical protein
MVIVLYMSEVCLDDEVDRGRGDDVNRLRDRLHLLRRDVGRWRITSGMRGRIVTRVDEIHSPFRRNQALFMVLTLRVSRGI